MDQTFTPLIERVVAIRERLQTLPLSDEEHALLKDELSTLVAEIQAHAGHEQGRAADLARRLAVTQEGAASALANSARAQNDATEVQRDATKQQRRTARFTLWLAVATTLMALFGLCTFIAQVYDNHTNEVRLLREARPMFSFVPTLTEAIPESTQVSFNVDAVNDGPGVASYLLTHIVYTLSADHVGLLDVNKDDVRLGTVGAGVVAGVTKTRENYADPASKSDSVVYLHLCCQYGAASNGRNYYQELVVFIRPIEFASADSLLRSQHPEQFCSSKIEYAGEVVGRGLHRRIRWEKQ